MQRYFLILFLIFNNNHVFADMKDKIIQNLTKTNNLSFHFEQNINGETEKGKCVIEYPKKIFCNYDSDNKKKLISNGKTLVVKTKTSYYLYPLQKTPLNLVLDREFLINQIRKLKEREIDKKFIVYTFNQNDNEINIFFDKIDYNLIGWQTLDIYQNLNITYLSLQKKNEVLKNNIFKLPSPN